MLCQYSKDTIIKKKRQNKNHTHTLAPSDHVGQWFNTDSDLSTETATLFPAAGKNLRKWEPYNSRHKVVALGPLCTFTEGPININQL